MKAGQTIFLKPKKDRYTGSQIIETTVTKVGRKYFWVDKLPRTKFSIEHMNEVTDYMPDYKPYLTKIEIEEEKEVISLERIISHSFRAGRTKYTINQLRRVYGILHDVPRNNKMTVEEINIKEKINAIVDKIVIGALSQTEATEELLLLFKQTQKI